MVESLINHVLVLSDEGVARISLEDISVCAAWLYANQENVDLSDQYTGIREKMDLWTRTVKGEPPTPICTRQQPFLRALIDKLQSNQLSSMPYDEVSMLFFASALARRSERPDLFARPMKCLEGFEKALLERRNSLEALSDLPNINDSICYLSSNEIMAAERREIKTFAGIHSPFLGPIFQFKGNVKILDQVPDGTAVVVEEGSCCIKGNVFGMVATTGGCEVQGDIAGMVIARKGHVRCQTIRNMAYVVSKLSSVYCSGAQTPRMVFGMEAIKVLGPARGGRYAARNIEFATEIQGGEIYCSKTVKAKNFICTDRELLSICLKRSLSSSDYGESMTFQGQRLLNNALHYHQILKGQNDLLNLAQNEEEDYASSILLHLLGEKDMRSQVEKLQHIGRRITFLERLLLFVNSIGNTLEEQLNLPEEHIDEPKGGKRGAGNEIKDLIESLNFDLHILSNEGPIERESYTLKEDILELARKAGTRNISDEDMLGLFKQTGESRNQVSLALQRAQKQFEPMNALLEDLSARSSVLEKARETGACKETLKKMLQLSGSKQASPAFRQQANDRYVKLMIRYMETRSSRVLTHKKNMEECQVKIDEIRAKLWKEHRITLPIMELGDDGTGIRAEGTFDPDVKIVAWPHLMESNELSGTGVLRTLSANAEQDCTYMRMSDGNIKLLEDGA